jgi:hypothetical protein
MYLSRLLLAIFAFGSAGTGAELLLLGHFEDVQQFIPLVLIAAGIGAAVWYGNRFSHRSLRAFQATLVLYAISALLGLYFHYSGNVEFEVERDPAIGGLRLFWEAITGATPALAPGSMLLLAAIGWAVTKAGSRSSVLTAPGPSP